MTQLFKDISGSFVYRDPGTTICTYCPIGSDWGEPGEVWTETDARWDRLARHCASSDLSVGKTKREPLCPIAMARHYLRDLMSEPDLLHRCEDIAAATLQPERISSIDAYRQGILIEKERLEFVEQLNLAPKDKICPGCQKVHQEKKHIYCTDCRDHRRNTYEKRRIEKRRKQK